MRRILISGLVTIFLTLLGVLSSSQAFAAPSLNGLAVHKQLGKDQFIAALYSETLTQDFKKMLMADEGKRMELKILANSIFSRRFKRMWIEGVAINAGSAELQRHAPNLADFSNMLKTRLKKGDLISISRSGRKDKGVTIELNGIELGVIQDRTFFDLLLRTWIGMVPLSSDFREGLLTGGTINPDILARYHSLSASAERVAEISTLVGAASATVAGTATKTAAGAVAAVVGGDGKKETTKKEEKPNEPAKTEAVAKVETPAEPVKEETPTETVVETAVKKDEQTAVAAAEPKAKPEEPKVAAIQPPVITTDLPGATLDEEEDLFEEDEEDFPITASSLLAEQLYISKVTRWTQENIKYPRISEKRNQEGTVRLTIEIDRKGNLLNVDMIASSQHKALNKAAVKAIQKASPYPAIPTELSGDTYRITIPVIFLLQEPGTKRR